MIYLRKANDQLICYCKCDKAEALISDPGQLDCPWCGCGWLFTCIKCRKAFTFAEAVEVDLSLEELAEMDIVGFGGQSPEPGEVDEWVRAMQHLLRGVDLG